MQCRLASWLAALMVLAVVRTSAAAEGPVPANLKASATARSVLAFFHSLTNRTERRVLSGQFSNFGPGTDLRIMEQVHTNTGKWPALLGVDYADFSQGRLHWANPNRAAVAYWKAGGLVTVSAHLYNPANPNGGGLREKGVDIATLLDPASPTHERWMKQLDELAQGLQELKDAGVVVLWRPFHEMNGGWFWWGAQKPEAFIKVWRHMFDYFTQTKNLDNLLWVYGPNHGNQTAAYYAGDAYTDLAGIDAYTDLIDPEHIRGVREVVTLGKPFGFTEYGPHGPQNPPGDYDYRRFGEGLQKHFPEAVFFMSWNSKWSLARNQNVADLLASPRIANRDDLPKDWGAR